jgi:dihydrofolate reductase
MRRLVVFNQVTLDGYFADVNGDMSWAHKADAEWKAFVADNASQAGSLLLFGRITYQQMAGYWPTPLAAQNDPIVAMGMNELPKVVFSRTLDKATWKNSRLVKDGLQAEVRRLKQEPGKPIAIMGSGSLVAQLAPEGLIDEYQVVVNPIVLGAGRSMFAGITKRLSLKLTSTRRFGNGNVLLTYEPGT